MGTRVRNIWFKEIIDSLRDKRALRQALLVPIFIGIVYALMMPVISTVFERQIEEQAREVLTITTIGVENVDRGLQAILSEMDIVLQEWDGSRDALAGEVAAGETKIALVVPAAFSSNIEALQPAPVEVLFNSGGSTFAVDTSTARLQGALELYSQQLVSLRLQERGIDPTILQPIVVDQVNLITAEQAAGQQSGYFLSLLIIVVVSGGLFVAIDVTAGEKERGTLEALLLTPATDAEIFFGKLLAVFTVTIVPLVLTFLGFGITSLLLPDSMSDGATIAPEVILGSILISLPLALAVSVVLMVIAVRTKTFKDAQSAATPVTLGILFPAMIAAFFPPSNTLLYVIPAYGTAALIGEMAATGAMPLAGLFLSVGGILLVALVGVLVGLRLFDRERLLYSM